MAESHTAAHRINADLHCHSVVSDGTLTPVEVVERAARNGVEILALTDHDELGGLAAARATADEIGLRFVDEALFLGDEFQPVRMGRGQWRGDS